MPVSAICSDLHFSDNPRDAYRLSFMAMMVALVKRNKIATLFILGDLTEEKDRHSAYLLNLIAQFIYDIAQLGCSVVILRGNHDGTDAANPYWFFLNYLAGASGGGVHFVVDACELRPYMSAFAAHKTILLPHTTDYKTAWAKIDFRKYRYAFAHATFEGAVAEGGFQLPGIPLSVFPKGIKVWSGDVHTPHTTPPVTYVGSPHLVDFGDDYQPRLILLDADGKEKSLSIPGAQKRLITVDVTRGLDRKRFVSAAAHANEGDIVKVRLQLPQARHAEFPAMRDKVREWANAAGLQVHLIQPVVTSTDQPVERGVVKADGTRPAKDDNDIMKRYATARQVDDETFKTGMFLKQRADTTQ